MTEPYPWQTAHWLELGRLQGNSRLPHALLFVGAAGLGKRDFADLLAKRLLCQSPDPAQQPCGSCRSCRLFAGGHHPDFHRVAAEGKRNAILVDQIRQLIGFVTLTSQHSGRKIACIEKAEQMNPNAANSFLKTLEEPPENTVLLLASDAAQRLPATIRSRCQLVRFSKPDRELALRWLADQGVSESRELLLDLANDSPLKARELAEVSTLARRRVLFEQFSSLLDGAQGPMKLAAVWHKEDAGEILRHLLGWTQDLLRLSTAKTTNCLQNKDLSADLEIFARRLPTAALFALLSRTQGMLQISETSVSPQLTFEDLLIDWARVAQSAGENQEN